MRVTASKVGLLTYCQAFARPEMEWPERERGAEATHGTRFHKAIAMYVACEPGVPLKVEDDIAQEFEHAKAWVDSLGVGKGALRAEVAFAWDPETDTAEVIKQEHDRDYSAGKGRLCGTADLVLVVTADGRPTAVMVWDWKTGDSLSSGPQLRTLGLMAARAYGVEHVTVAALDVSPERVVELVREELDAFALSGIAGEIAEQLSLVATSEPQPGSHCYELFCPAKLACPVAQVGAAELVNVIPADKLVRRPGFKLSDPVETAEQAIYAVDVVRLIGAKLEDIKREIRSKMTKEEYVDDHGKTRTRLVWAASDGRVLKDGTCDTTGFDQAKALALVKQLGATPEQIASLHYTFERGTGLRVSGGGAKPRTKRSKAA